MWAPNGAHMRVSALSLSGSGLDGPGLCVPEVAGRAWVHHEANNVVADTVRLGPVVERNLIVELRHQRLDLFRERPLTLDRELQAQVVECRVHALVVRARGI